MRVTQRLARRAEVTAFLGFVDERSLVQAFVLRVERQLVPLLPRRRHGRDRTRGRVLGEGLSCRHQRLDHAHFESGSL